MAATYGASGGIAYSAVSGTTVAPAYPTGITTSSQLILIIGQKPATANGGTLTTPTGWTRRAELGGTDRNSPAGVGGYTTTLAGDTGNTRLYILTKDTVSGSESGTLSVTVGDNNVCFAEIHRVQAPGATFATALGYQPASGNVAITLDAVDLAAGDLCLGAIVIPTDFNTPTLFNGDWTLAQTGTTFTAGTEIDEADTNVGNDLGAGQFYVPVSAGAGTGTVDLTCTCTPSTGNSVRGPAGIIRIREAGGTTFTITPTGSMASAGAPTRRPGKFLAGAQSPSGTIGRTPAKALAGAIASAGAPTRRPAKALAGTLTSSGTVARLKLSIIALAGAIASSGALARTAGKALAGTASSSGTVTRRPGKALAGAVTSSGTLTRAKVALLALAGAMASSGALSRRAARALAGTLTSAGAVTSARAYVRAFAGTLTSAGAVTRAPAKVVAGAVTSSGTVARAKVALLALAGTIASSAALARRPAKVFAGAVAPVGTLARRTAKAAAGTLTSAGTLTRSRVVLLAVAGALSPSAVLRRRAARALAGTLAADGQMTRQTRSRLAGTLSWAGTLVAAAGGVEAWSWFIVRGGVLRKATAKLGGQPTSTDVT